MVIYITQPQVSVPIETASKNDPRIQNLVDQIRKDQLSAEAPNGFDPVVWTPSDEARLDAALAKRAAKRNAAV